MANTVRRILQGIKERQAAAGDNLAAGQVLQRAYEMMADPAVVARDQSDNMDKRFQQAGEIAMAMFHKAGTDMNKLDKAIEAIGNTKPRTAEKPVGDVDLIPKDHFWSSDRQRGVTRQHILDWCTATYDIAEGDRFWSGPRDYVGIAKVPTASGAAWMLTAYRDGKCVSSAQTTSAFELMVFVDQWLGHERA